jgi:hypothetical protein
MSRTEGQGLPGDLRVTWYCFNLMMADIMATEPTERNNTRLNNIWVSFRGFRG